MSVRPIHPWKAYTTTFYPRLYPISPPLTVCGSHVLLHLNLASTTDIIIKRGERESSWTYSLGVHGLSFTIFRTTGF